MHRVLPALVALLGVVVAVTGLLLAGPLDPASGWTAYSPLSTEVYAPGLRTPWWTLALIVAGSALAGAGATATVLRRSPPR